MSKTVLSIENVSYSYNSLPVLEDINLTVEAGEFLGLVGPNGGGKTTLLKLVLGLLKPDTGRITVFGHQPHSTCHHLAYVPQRADFSRDFPITVLDAVLLGRINRNRWGIGYTRAERERALGALRESHILDLRDRRLNQLSGGQLQRVLIARALVSDPEMLILDEPTANIDQRAEEDIFDLFRQLNERMTLILVSHDIGFISQYVNRVACLNRTMVCHQTADIDGKAIEDLYGTPVRMIAHSHTHEPAHHHD